MSLGESKSKFYLGRGKKDASSGFLETGSWTTDGLYSLLPWWQVSSGPWKKVWSEWTRANTGVRMCWVSHILGLYVYKGGLFLNLVIKFCFHLIVGKGSCS